MDRLAPADLLVDLPQQVDHLRVHLGRFVLPPVPQEVVHLVQPVLVETVAALERDVRAFLGVNVVELQRARLRVGICHGAERKGEGDHQGRRGPAGEAAAHDPPSVGHSSDTDQNISPCRLLSVPGPIPDGNSRPNISANG